MAITAIPPPQQLITPLREVQSDYQFEGDGGKRLEISFRTATEQWVDRPSVQIEQQDSDSTVNHVPFKKVGTKKVRFKPSVPMKARTIATEDAG